MTRPDVDCPECGGVVPSIRWLHGSAGYPRDYYSPDIYACPTCLAIVARSPGREILTGDWPPRYEDWRVELERPGSDARTALAELNGLAPRERLERARHLKRHPYLLDVEEIVAVIAAATDRWTLPKDIVFSVPPARIQVREWTWLGPRRRWEDVPPAAAWIRSPDPRQRPRERAREQGTTTVASLDGSDVAILAGTTLRAERVVGRRIYLERPTEIPRHHPDAWTRIVCLPMSLNMLLEDPPREPLRL